MRTEVIGNCRLYCCDCRDVLGGLSGIDAVVTDPPWGSATDTNYTRFSGTGKGRKDYAHLRKQHAPIIGDDAEFDPSPLLGFPVVILWGANHFSSRLPKGAWLVWDKRSHSGHALLADGEVAWMSRGTGVYLFDHCWHGFARASETGEFYHPSQKPVALMEWCLERASLGNDDAVLDPYMGAGATGLACIRAGCSFVGIESDEHHYETACRRIEQAVNAMPLFAEPPLEQAELFAEAVA